MLRKKIVKENLPEFICQEMTDERYTFPRDARNRRLWAGDNRRW